MRVMMLDGYDRNRPLQRFFLLLRQLLSKSRGLVSGMKITGDHLRLYLQKCLHPSYGLTQRPDRTHIRKVSYIGGRVEQRIFPDAEGVLQLAADRKDNRRAARAGSSGLRRSCFCSAAARISVLQTILSRDRAKHHRKRCISARAADHVRSLLREVHDGIITSDPDLPVVRQDAVTESGDLPQGFLIIPADRRAGYISAGHDQHVRYRAVIRIVKQQHLDRRVGEHDAHLGIARRHCLAQLRSAA